MYYVQLLERLSEALVVRTRLWIITPPHLKSFLTCLKIAVLVYDISFTMFMQSMTVWIELDSRQVGNTLYHQPTVHGEYPVLATASPPPPHPLFPGLDSPNGPGPHFRGFEITLSTPLSIGLLWTSDRSPRDLYLTVHNSHKRETSMPPSEFEPSIPGSERPPGSNVCRNDSKRVNCYTLRSYLPDSWLSFCCRKQIGLWTGLM